MAENKGIMLAKSMQKHAGRAKEKILQNLGKVDRTADEIFDDHLNNFNRQQTNANRLQKEFNNYIRCIRAAQGASKSLMDAICEIYEPQWSGYEALQAQSQSSESLWLDFAHKLGDQVLIPLNTYTGQFPEMKKKVDKRNRKLIDYDGQRHSFQNLQANANKRKDDVKLTKGRDQLEEARRTYELLNTELHDELPALYDSRILFLVTNLQTLFATEQVFHTETAKIYSELEAIVDKLATESQRGSNTLRNQALNAMKAASPVQSPVKQMNNANIANSNQYQNTNGSANPPSPSSSSNAQEPRLDNVSPTPETLAEAAAPPPATTSATGSPSAAAMSASTRSNQSMSANSSNLVSDATAVDSSTNSPNAIARKLRGGGGVGKVENNSNIAKTIEETTKDEDANKDMMNNITTTTSSNVITSTTNAATIDSTTDMAMKKDMATQQINGNDNEVKTNGNVSAAPMEKNLETETTINTTTTTTTTTATTTSTTNGNNANPTTTVTNSPPSMKTTSNTNPDESNKKQLGNNLTNDTLNRSRSSNRNSKQVVVPSSKNPFEEDADDDNDVKNIDEDLYKIPKDATTTDLPPGVLYRVKATYGYVKEDVDELSFEVGDIIRVIEYDDPEDQEEGWLMGEKEGGDEKGLFPANFTRPI